MQQRVENGMKASRHQGYGELVAGEKAGKVLHVGGELNASVARPLGRQSWGPGQFERDGGNRHEVPRLASFAGARRIQLAVLMEAAVTAGLREVVTGVTCLASVRPVSPRLTGAPIVLAGVGGLRRDLDMEVDEGGIYSW